MEKISENYILQLVEMFASVAENNMPAQARLTFHFEGEDVVVRVIAVPEDMEPADGEDG